MKKFLKVLLIIVLVIIVPIGGYFVYLKFFAKIGNRDAFSVVPSNAIFIVETTNLSKAWTTLSESELWKYLIATPYFADVNEDIETVNKFLKSNPIADAMLNERKLIMSAHMISGNDWDFLITVDLQDASNAVSNIGTVLNLIPDYKLVKKDFKDDNNLFSTTIYELKNTADSTDKIYISLVDNLLLFSFSGTLIQNAISQADDEHWENNKRFREVTANLNDRKLFKLYFNFNQLDDFSKTFLTSEDEVITMLSKSLSFSIFDIDLQDNKLSFDGYTNLDSLNTYIRALANVNPGKYRADEIVTDRTAIYFSIAFSKYTDFYENLMNEYKVGSPQDYTDITEGIKLAEKLLKISLQDDFFSWIGNEIALFKLRPMTEDEREEDIVIAINASDIEQAKTGLTHITDQIRKRTSIKFDVVNYRNFEINYLSEKGLIRLLFGKLFDRIEKPYFTYIEDYVVMSNSQEILMSVIDDYVAGKTLSHNVAYTNFKDNFEKKSNFSLFVQMPKVYTLLYHYTPSEDLESFRQNKDLILGFARIGFQLTSNGEMFKTTLISEYDPAAVVDDELEKIDAEAQNDLSNADYENLSFKINISADSLKNNGVTRIYYPGTTNILNEGNISGNKINGVWRTYYESGNLKSAVNYLNGTLNGISYFYFDDEVNTVATEINFENDVIIDSYKEFYDNGAQKAVLTYKDAKANGKAEFYYKTGKLKIEGEYKDGIKDGKWKYYDINGDLISKEKWKEGDKK